MSSFTSSSPTPPADVDRFVRETIFGQQQRPRRRNQAGDGDAVGGGAATAAAPLPSSPEQQPQQLPAAALFVTGGGTQALAWLLATPGASRLVVDAAAPYSREATADLILRGALPVPPPLPAAATSAAAATIAVKTAGGDASVPPPSPPTNAAADIDVVTAVTAATALRLAEAAYRRAARLTPLGRPCVGLGATSALASGDPPRRGAHRTHVAAVTAGGAVVATLEMAKGGRTRWEEDGVAARLVLRVLARAVREAAAGASDGGGGGGGGGGGTAEGSEEAQQQVLDLGLLPGAVVVVPSGADGREAAAPVDGPAGEPRDVLTERVLFPPLLESPRAAGVPADACLAVLSALADGRARCVEFSPGGRVCAVDAPRGGGASVSGAAPPVVYLSGSFNPLHGGHEGLLLAARRAAEAALLRGGEGGGEGGGRGAPTATASASAAAPPAADPPPPSVPGCFELSIGNADKGALPPEEAARRARQFARRGLPLLATAGAALFTQKAALLPGAWFAVGHDTAARLVQPRYYDRGGDADGGRAQMALQLGRLRAAGCRFLVAGRAEAAAAGGGGGGGGAEAAAAAAPGRRFLTLADIAVPPELAGLFVEIPEEAFRNDVSSTELRAREAGL